MSAQSGWYPDPGGSPGLFRYWDGKAWSAATSSDPRAAAPTTGLVDSVREAGSAGQGQSSGQPQYGQGQYGQGQPAAYGSQPTGAYANYQQAQTKKKSPIGWWIGGAVLLIVLVIIGVIAVRAITGGGGIAGRPGGPGTQDVCPKPESGGPSSSPHPSDGRVHGGPMSYPQLGSPWGAPQPDERVPFGIDTQVQMVDVERNYQPNSNWVASILVAELQAGDGFFTPEQGSQIVVRCILGTFYGANEVKSTVKVNKAIKIDGQDGWLVESQLSFDIKGLKTKGELLIVAIAASGATAGLYYASIPDTRPELVAPARKALAELKVD